MNEDVSHLSYEQALAELQSVVEALEQGDQPLEEAVKLFERGRRLLEHCTRLLEEARLKVRLLTEPPEELPEDLRDFFLSEE